MPVAKEYPPSPAKSAKSYRLKPSSSIAISGPSSIPNFLRPFFVSMKRPPWSCLNPSFPTLSVKYAAFSSGNSNVPSLVLKPKSFNPEV